LTGTSGGEALDVAAVGGNILGGGVGGAVLTWVVGFIKQKLDAR
jgi:fucose permease